MSQNSLTLPTTGTVSGLQMTQNTNNAIDTLNTLASGASAPSSPEAGQLWHDTTNNLLKIRSLDNSTWVPFLQLNEVAYGAAPYNANVTNERLNRIINGGMTIDQVNEGTSYNIPTNNTLTYTADQWEAACLSSTASGVTVQRVTDAPAGFTNSLKLTVGTGASSVGTSDYLPLWQPIEANNLSDLNFGTANAVPLSLSFWVKSSIAGTFAVVLQNAAATRSCVNKFTVASGGVWQFVTIPNIPGDQAGTWATGNSLMLNAMFIVATGTGFQTTTFNTWSSGVFYGANTQTNSILTTSGATFQITGVQLNSGIFNQPYEKRLPMQELQLCERYFQKTFPQGTAVAQNAGLSGALGFLVTASQAFGVTAGFRSAMRTSATLATYNPSAANANWRDTTSSADRTVSPVSTSDKSTFIAGLSGASGTFNQIQFTVSARM